VKRWLADNGWKPAQPPPGFNYLYLRTYTLTELNGNRVPYLLFVRPASQGGASAVAEVYILSRKDFSIHDLNEGERSGDLFKVRVERPADSRDDYVYVIVSTGNLDELRSPNPQSQ
jgi:hypothetical protein